MCVYVSSACIACQGRVCLFFYHPSLPIMYPQISIRSSSELTPLLLLLHVSFVLVSDLTHSFILSCV